RHISQSPGGGLRSMLSVTGVSARVAPPPCCWVIPAVTDRARSGNPSADAFRRRLSIGVVLPYSGCSLGSMPIDRKIMENIQPTLVPHVNSVRMAFASHLCGGCSRPRRGSRLTFAISQSRDATKPHFDDRRTDRPELCSGGRWPPR